MPNETVVSFTRQSILSGLSELPSKYVDMFKRMYSFQNRHAPIEEIVANMPEEKLDLALTQVERSLTKINQQRRLTPCLSMQ